MAPVAPVADQDDFENHERNNPPKRTNDRIYPRRAAPLFRPSRIGHAQYQEFNPVTGISNMSSQVRIQSQADDVLRQLEPIPAGPFGPEHQLIIARNMALIQGVTANTLSERREAERRRRVIERMAREAVRLTNPDYRAFVESDDEDEYEGDTSAPGGGGGGGGSGSNKRSRSDDDDDYRKQVKQAKRARLYANPELQIQEPVDITKLAPLPLQISYPAHPTTDRPDTWFVDNFTQLYRQIEAVVSHYYSLHEIPIEAEPWLECKMTPEFVKWAEQVAEPNPRFGSWDELLRDRVMRKWFVMAVVVKIFKVKVFDVYLFGATREQVQLIHQVDRAFLGREGFQREELRAKQASTILGSASVTETFYPSVAKLTAQIALLLSPLTTYLYSLPPPSGTPAPSIHSLYQSLHNLVSQAAYLSLCVKLTPSIIQIHDLRPGDKWHPDDMHCLDTEGFVDSKRTIGNDWKQERHNMKVFTEKAYGRMKELAPPLREGREGRGTRRYRRARKVWEDMQGRLAEKNGAPPTYTHRALIKIAVWPVIRRYTPGSVEEGKGGEAGKPLREKDGFCIFLVGKGAVCAYYGRDVKRVEEYCTLGEWVGVKKRQRDERVGWLETVGRLSGPVLSVLAAVAVVGKAGLVMDQVVGMGGTEIVDGLVEGAKGLVGEGLEGVRQYAAAVLAG
ncbi:hypothetical protein BKA65DRAFT_569898 [Rhexocercosporidium sp. MPI-PUGE-AT-0058]|nr:hypothetical protein BKA65DRAFT_569898 [Rhexocercosporidium sp. MPI-PUGE-AT-0058]